MISDNIVQGSPLAAVNDGSRIALFCQHAEGVFRVIMEPIGGSSIQKKGTDVTTITGSPIALIVMTSVDNPQPVNAYYVDKNYNLVEFPDILGSGDAKSLSATANPIAGLAAITYTLNDANSQPVLYKSVFYQDFATNKIRRLTCTGETWGEPEDIPVTSLVGTALAAAVHVDDNKATIHLYYQHENITLRELILAPDESTWSDGNFEPGNVTLQGPLATTVVSEKNTILVYYRELSGGSYVGKELTSGSDDGAITTSITEDSEFRHTAVQVDDKLRFYYQTKTGDLYYRVSDLDGEDWEDPKA